MLYDNAAAGKIDLRDSTRVIKECDSLRLQTLELDSGSASSEVSGETSVSRHDAVAWHHGRERIDVKGIPDCARASWTSYDFSNLPVCRNTSFRNTLHCIVNFRRECHGTNIGKKSEYGICCKWPGELITLPRICHHDG